MSAPSPLPVPDRITVNPGPALLSGVDDGPGLAAHRARFGALPAISLATMQAACDELGLRGRGGAGFPFAVKLATTARSRRRPIVVVNAAEGEPASAKDATLALTAPHLVLDGAVATARALAATEIHLVLPAERPAVGLALAAAVAERDDRMPIHQHTTSPGFVSGQARAVIELLSGRPNLPVTAWQPEAKSGLRGRPTLLSNAETWAQVGLLVLRGLPSYRALGTPTEPGTTLLTVHEPGRQPTVREVAFGTELREVLAPESLAGPVLIGGFHGAWAAPGRLGSATLSSTRLRDLGLSLGAGVVIAHAGCPVEFTRRIVDYLAGQSAGRCGPCRHGLPALADALGHVAYGTGSVERVAELSALVTGRGACAHPDGTARLVSSLLVACPTELHRHATGRCGTAGREVA